MKLSNTLVINEALLPSGKKAFTLAEVLITLSILGVVAALTIPALVNRNSDIAAQTKLKKAIAAYETAAAVYMAESGKANTDAWLSDKGTASCDNVGSYFKIVNTVAGTNNCEFTTSDGVLWRFNGTSGYAVAYDSAKGPRYGVVMWTTDGNVNSSTYATINQTKVEGEEEKDVTVSCGTTSAPATCKTLILANAPAAATSITAAPVHGYYNAPAFLNASSSALTAGTATGKASTIAGATQKTGEQLPET